jgi:hypothetical protein
MFSLLDEEDIHLIGQLLISLATAINLLEVRMLKDILILQEVHIVLPNPILKLFTQLESWTVLWLLLLLL